MAIPIGTRFFHVADKLRPSFDADPAAWRAATWGRTTSPIREGIASSFVNVVLDDGREINGLDTRLITFKD